MSDLTQSYLAALASDAGGPTEPTSVRLPRGLRNAMKLAKQLGYDVDFAGLAETTLRSALADIAQDIVFAEFDTVAPHSAPTLGELAWAAAVFDNDALAGERAFLDRIAHQVALVKPDADGDDVLFAARMAQQLKGAT